MTKIASAIFDSHTEAERAVSELRSAGVSDSALSVIAQHSGGITTRSGDGDITDDDHRNLLRGILGGGALSGTPCSSWRHRRIRCPRSNGDRRCRRSRRGYPK
jgi:hypothetical protein